MKGFVDAASAVGHPIYLDWSFWAVIVAALALVLSQLPPLVALFRRGRLDVFVHKMVAITHKVGNPNLLIFVAITHKGGREVQVDSVNAVLRRDGKLLVDLDAQGYFEKQSDDNTLLFVPFRLNAKERWAHAVAIHNVLSRQVEKDYRRALSNLKTDIADKIKARPDDDKNPVEASTDNLQFFLDLFEKQFIWTPGEYEFDLVVNCTPAASTNSKKYRFTLFESDTEDLRRHVDDYKYGGGGITFESENTFRAFIPVLPRD